MHAAVSPSRLLWLDVVVVVALGARDQASDFDFWRLTTLAQGRTCVVWQAAPMSGLLQLWQQLMLCWQRSGLSTACRVCSCSAVLLLLLLGASAQE